MPVLFPVVYECRRCHAFIDGTVTINEWDKFVFVVPPGWTTIVQVQVQEFWCGRDACKAAAQRIHANGGGRLLEEPKGEAEVPAPRPATQKGRIIE